MENLLINKNMEENKEIKKKLTYEELENAAHQLSEQSRQLYTRLQEADLSNLFKRLDYLFKVLNSDNFFPKEFVESCATEIMDIITIPKEGVTTTTTHE
jgi:hypothetical protein